MKRVLEESLAGRFLADVVESTEANIGGLHNRKLLQEHHSPELRFIKDEVVVKGKRGVFYWADRETYISLGFNTSHISVEEAPKRTQDLLDPRFKGKISLAGGATAAAPNSTMAAGCAFSTIICEKSAPQPVDHPGNGSEGRQPQWQVGYGRQVDHMIR